MLAPAIFRKVGTLLIVATVLAQRGSPQSGQYGEVVFANSGGPAAQPAFLRGLALLHNFQYPEAADAFREAQRVDPSFLMAYWGEAMTYNHGVWREQDSLAARAVLTRLASMPNERITAREHAFLEAIQALYAPGKPKASRDTVYALAMQRVAARDENDVEAQLFYALSLLSLFPRTDSTYLKAAAIAERVMRDHPRHPGALHYVIHAYDNPQYAQRGLAAAREYSKVAPDAPHAQHMTSHIFIALGMWDDVVAANEVSTKMAKALCGHGAIWLHYAYLQQGRRADASKMEDVCYDAAASSPMMARGFVEMRLQSLVDGESLGDTKVARALSINRPGSTSFAKTYGTAFQALRRGDTTRMGVLFDSLAQLQQSFAKTPMARQMPEMGSSMDVMTAELHAMLLLNAGRPEDAIRLMQQTAVVDDGIPFEFGPPAVAKPTHELLGEMLLSRGRAAEAEKEFEFALTRTPGRSTTLRDLARASRAAGDSVTSSRAAAQLRANWHRADASVIQAGQEEDGHDNGSDALSRDELIAVSVLPLPEHLRAGAGVVTFDTLQRMVELRGSSNGMVCARFHEAPWDARCYHQSFAPAFFRARALRARGPNDITAEMETEIRAGKLKLPTVPTAGYRMLGPASAYDVKTGRMTAQMRVWQSIHMPFRTAKEIGLPDEYELTASQQTSTPFVMSGGTWWSHVMILHPRADSIPR